MRDMVLILNFDNAGSRAVARGLRAEHVACQIVPAAISAREVASLSPLGLIFAGGVSGRTPAAPDPELLNGAWPVLALGDAAAALCQSLGGGVQELTLCGSIGSVRFARCPLTEGVDDCERMLHNVRRLTLPDSLTVLAESQGETVGFMHRSLPLYGVQFSLESNDTDGMRLLLGFALSVCGCTRWWDYEAFTGGAVEEIRRAAGDGRAVCVVTGGLVSGVSALLAHKALGDRLQCVFVDTGLLRENEGAQFLSFYRDQAGLPIVAVQAQERFMEALRGVVDPRQKRAAVAEAMRGTLQETFASLDAFQYIVRGVTCQDALGGEKADGAPDAAVPALEPLRELFRDEIRQEADFLGVPAEIAARQDFPDCGLALRIVGEATPARLQTLRAADRIFLEEVAASGQGKRLWQHFAVLSALPGDSARVMIALRAVNYNEAAQQIYAARLPFDLLERVTGRVLRERPEVVRVVYDLSPNVRQQGVEWQ